MIEILLSLNPALPSKNERALSIKLSLNKFYFAQPHGRSSMPRCLPTKLGHTSAKACFDFLIVLVEQR